jgi:hypothetical protein
MRKPEDYLAQAREAEESARRAHSAVAKHCWRTIAETYRALAAECEGRPANSQRAHGLQIGSGN